MDDRFFLVPFWRWIQCLLVSAALSFFVRFLHYLIYLRHALMMYVGNMLLFQDAPILPPTASMVLAFCAILGIPISWKKLQLGPLVLWISWNYHFRAGGFSIPQDKLDRLRSEMEALLGSRTVLRKDLQKVIGLIQWLIQQFWVVKPWLHCLYTDVNSPLNMLFSVDPGDWTAFCGCRPRRGQPILRGLDFARQDMCSYCWARDQQEHLGSHCRPRNG